MNAPTQIEKAIAFRKLHERAGAFVIPNPWDAGTAKILAALGFEALATTSAGLAFSLGKPDGAGEVTREETLANAKAISEATPLPVSADLENGFGDAPEDAAETIRLAGAAGLAGGSIEDATMDESQPIYDFALAVERVRAAVEAARSLPHPFVLTARSENFLHGRNDLKDTIRRLQAFEEAGADVLYAPGLPDIEAVRTVCAEVSKPVNFLAGTTRSKPYSVGELAAAGVKRISIGSAFSRVALGAFLRAAQEIASSGTFDRLRDSMPYPTANQFMQSQG